MSVERLSTAGFDLLRIDVTAGVGQAASSFLVYKVLADPHASGERMPPPPAEIVCMAPMRSA